MLIVISKAGSRGKKTAYGSRDVPETKRVIDEVGEVFKNLSY
jgi:hypothetical protein